MSVSAPSPASAANLPLQNAECPVCASLHVHYAFSSRGTRVLQCAECRFTFRTADESVARPDDTVMLRLALEHEFLGQVAPALGGTTPRLARIDDDGARNSPLASGPDSSTILVSIGDLDASRDPLPALRRLRERLTAGQRLVFVYSDIHRTGAEIGSRQWERLLGERNAYLDTQTALTLLFRAGFRCLGVRRLRRQISLDELLVEDGTSFVSSRWRRHLLQLVPAPLRRVIRVTSRSADVAIASELRPTEEPLVSVVVPVYNEARTIEAVLDAVLRVTFRGAQVEVVVVESNSTDGSREIVQRYAANPRVTCIFENRPHGKGHATRLGLTRARGDILIIQDADLEYDIEDYHSLIDPIIRGHEAFMLGSRHGGRNHWKLRQFQKPMLASLYNLAHVLVTAYINLLFGLRLRDPQTMFKVCRRDCIESISFEGNFFNFDYELLLKIVRKGYEPIEVPVNYRSRSHAEGKKIRMWRDAPLGLWMITKLRLTPLRRFLSLGEPIE